MASLEGLPDERRADNASLDPSNNNNTAKITQHSPRDDDGDHDHNTAALQSAEYSDQSGQAQQPLTYHAHPPLSFRPHNLARFGVAARSALGQANRVPSAAPQALNATSAQFGIPALHKGPTPEPASSSVNAVSTTENLAFDEQQQAQERSTMRNRSRSLNGDHTTQARSSHGRPASSRHRSRSPVLATQPLSYRDRSPTRHQGSSALDRSGESESAGVDDVSMDDAVAAERQRRMPELQKEKNKHATCVLCWLKELPCDHQWPCKECKTRGKPCAYIVCPMANCALDVKCPAYHKNKKLPDETRKIGCPMHMLALLNLNRPLIDSYDVQKIQKKTEDPGSAQQIHLLLQQEIEHIVQQKTKLENPMAMKLL
ncbi:unnamed protein product [Aureobasidium mustum]|uniref:Zn(2)-C6 fungal-type domain-containing protein n=1 Tax=Aureobasidium mustum TaxID=2773714 RepID=A0A9N8K9A1_9PEZI|nr:unnamed protein product [Aureobasidium mustum]